METIAGTTVASLLDQLWKAANLSWVFLDVVFHEEKKQDAHFYRGQDMNMKLSEEFPRFWLCHALS